MLNLFPRRLFFLEEETGFTLLGIFTEATSFRHSPILQAFEEDESSIVIKSTIYFWAELLKRVDLY